MLIQKIKKIKQEYQENNFRGGISFLILEIGGLEQIKKEFGTIDNFCRNLIQAGYNKGYISRVKKRLKNKTSFTPQELKETLE